MSLDQLMQAVSQFASWLLPVAGVAVLVYLVLFLKTLIETLKDLSLTLLTAQNEIEKLDGPLQTLDDLSKTVDEVHAAMKQMASSAARSAQEGMEHVRGWFSRSREEAQETADTIRVNADDMMTAAAAAADKAMED